MNINIELTKEDITQLDVDAVVTAANSRLRGGGGVDGAIHRAAGSQLLIKCKEIYEKNGECEAGYAVITKGYKLNAKYVIHAVGPIWHGGRHREKETLASAYIKCLRLAQEYEVYTIAFPNISTGVYGFPKNLAANIAVLTVKKFFEVQSESTIHTVYFACFETENFELYSNILNK